ncbi:6,7-dimethyl-8-ribityllumazine synthase [Buchnera aphidicola]|uniref:6,7-dimethyl-8-ribityllumazine synthase n=1 Tax=Buchnera aphidicola (Sarucallis kahawaluokalani) TaxID=1241878 RepID=A0A4D6Y941_9GAMM|nr:6,7-dimethyl-8-ribityllumazine synthase [Buchnera aphidicola]QCI26197.1 6,7-dimethyl-8-ribityllumazine synthase [Buchnera aphidicola (Sarucallis kahawaluokalani)]
MKIIQSDIISKDAKIAIIVPRFNNFININLLNGAIDILNRMGQVKNENITIIKIPGSYEIPIIANILTHKCKYHGIIALGTIIKGETIHFHTLSSDITTKISNISIKTNIPIALGILMTENIEQAIHRSGAKLGNKGSEAALTILEMINVIKNITK